MSQENVEVIRSGFAAFEAGDMDRAYAPFDPEVVVRREHPAPDARTYHGIDGVKQSLADWTTDFDQFEMSAKEFICAGDAIVAVRIHQRARGRSSGAVVEGDFWFVYTLVQGKITRLEMFARREQALEAAGLRE